jgi:pimeloyl-ACP methyl ester carboxylesterase
MRAFATACVLAALQASAVAASDTSAYARPHQLVDIGGRKLNLYCTGTGSPTVVFDAGAGLAGWDWLLVHPHIAKTNKACVYDRAGLGFSEPSGRPGTASNAADDLHALLTAAALKPPFVLVAHSYAAMSARLFTHRHPAWVSALVLVDGQHEDEGRRLDRVTQGRYSQLMGMLREEEKGCVEAARSGFKTEPTKLEHCTGTPPAAFGPELQAAYRAQMASLVYWEASHSESSNLFTHSADQVRAQRQALGALPLRSLTRGVGPYDTPGKPPSATSRAAERENKAMQDEVAALSTRGRNRVVQGAGHSIHLDKPQAVIDAIKQALVQAAQHQDRDRP